MSLSHASNELETSLPEPEYDHLDLSFNDLDDVEGNAVWDDPVCKKSTEKLGQSYSEYILGTLIIRIVAARDLEPVQKSGLIDQFLFGGRQRSSRMGRMDGSHRGSANPYASIRYCGQSQRTSEVFDTTDPVWPRGETMYLDVTLPVSDMVLEEDDTFESRNDDTRATAASSRQEKPLRPQLSSVLPKPILTVGVFHASGDHAKAEKYPAKGGKQNAGDSDDPFLGMTAVDLTSLITGKVESFDEWLPLTGTGHSRGKVRLVCEYEASDPPPRFGDTLRFTSYCNPADLYPAPPGGTYVVKEVDGDNLVLEFKSPEGWMCTFSGHRYMFVCEKRHQGAIETCQKELHSISERLSHSPLVSTLVDAVEKVPDEGLVFIGANAVQEGASLLGRWLGGGIGTAVEDIVYATNWDGRFNPNNESAENDSDARANSQIERDTQEKQEKELSVESAEDASTNHAAVERKALPGMPCCPITGEPMIDPVVAADGHTYERSAILRWFQTSNISPLTAAPLSHKELVSNYMLLSSFQESISPLTPRGD